MMAIIISLYSTNGIYVLVDAINRLSVDTDTMATIIGLAHLSSFAIAT